MSFDDLDGSVGKQAVDIELTGCGSGIISVARVVAAGTDVDFSVGDRRHLEFDGISSAVAATLGAIPELIEVCGIVSVEHGGPASWGLRGAVLAVVKDPENGVGV